MMRLRMPVETISVSDGIHNGSNFRDSVPLRKEERPMMRLRMPVEAVCVSDGIHNGSVSRDSVPLRFK